MCGCKGVRVVCTHENNISTFKMKSRSKGGAVEARTNFYRVYGDIKVKNHCNI